MTQKEHKFIDKYMRRELGESPAGGPLFRWIHSESEELRHPMVARGEFDYRCQCGLNVNVHQPGCTLTLPVQKIKFRKTCPTLKNQWLIAKWYKPTFSEYAFEQEFGGRAVYPRQGYYMPVGYSGPPDQGCPTKYISLDPGIEPNRKITEAFVSAMKRELEKKFHEIVAEGEEQVLLRERESSAKRAVLLDNRVRFPFNKIPGKRGGSVSLRSPVPKATTTAEPAIIQP